MSSSVYGYDTNVLTPSQTQQAGTGVPTPTFQFVNADGSKTVDGELSSKINEEDTIFTVRPKSLLDAGNWTIYIRSISDDVGNTSATVSYPLVVQGVTVQGEPVIIWADAHDNQYSVSDGVYRDMVRIQYGTVMSQDVLKSNVYTINGKVLPPGTMVTSEDVKYDGTIEGTRVTITLPYTFLGKITEEQGASPSEPHILNVSTSLKDAKGNPIKPPTEVQLTYGTPSPH